jgi:hypothetical protein
VARAGLPKAGLVLTHEERTQMVRWSRRAKLAQVSASHSWIVLWCADGQSNAEVAADVEGTATTLGMAAPVCGRSVGWVGR